MKAIKEAQTLDINDNCTTCGSILDIGAVITESDTLLNVEFELSESGLKAAENLAEQANANFKSVDTKITEQESKVLLSLNFDVAVEKMLFQMQNEGL